MKKIFLLSCILSLLFMSVCFAKIPIAEMKLNNIGIDSTREEVRNAFGVPTSTSHHEKSDGIRGGMQYEFSYSTDSYYLSKMPNDKKMTAHEISLYVIRNLKQHVNYIEDKVKDIVVFTPLYSFLI